MQQINFKILFVVFFFNNVLGAQGQLSQVTADKIDDLFRSYSNKPGCAIGIFKDGNIIYQKEFGLANLDYEIPVTSETVFDLASVSKQFAAACIYLLEIDGKLNLNDPIQKYLPEMPVYEEGTITISNLVHQTSGLRDYLAILHSKGISWDSNFENRDALKLLSKQRGINFKPNSRYAYSNTNYLLLSEIIERISGESIGKFAKKRIFEPLKMTNTFYYENKGMIVKNRAIGYEYHDDKFNMSHFFNSVATGDGGVNSTIDDLFKWNENFKTGKVGGKLLIEKMLSTNKLNNGAHNEYAGGLFVSNYRNMPEFPRIGHSGEWAGSRSLYFKFLKQDLGFAILSNNASTNVWSILDQIIPLFLERELNAASQNQVSNQEDINLYQIKGNSLDRFTGNFFNILDGTTRKVIVKNDSLIYKRPNGVETKLIPVDESQFIFEIAPLIRLDFGKKNELLIFINKNPPLVYSKYTPKSYTNLELNKFKGNYYSDELNVNYEIKPLNGNLQILIDSKEFITLEPVTENIFNAEHFGYLKFIENNKDVITGFIRNDDIIMNIQFKKITTLSN